MGAGSGLRFPQYTVPNNMADSNNTVHALIVDDEADIRELIDITLSRMAIKTVTVANLADALAALQRTTFNLCLTDMRLPDGSGIDLIRRISEVQPACPVAVITAYGSVETAVDSLKAGAFDFVAKPIDIAALRSLVGQALKLPGPEAQAHDPAARPNGATDVQMIGQTPVMQNMRKTIAKLARSQAPVYIIGESGTGKELVARSIHASGARADGAFVPVNCGAIPTELMESEFFGHRKGAFTGADRDRTGLIAEADGGTLFLDEVADLPLAMQVKLLRVIQDRVIRPVGGTSEQPVDMRIICATHRNLAREVARGNFREDLFYRLNVIEVSVPPLRARAADIPLLAEMTLQRLAQQLALDPAPSLSAAAMATLQTHSFPGNVRELQNILERAVTLSDEAVIGPEYLRLQSPLNEPPKQHGSDSGMPDTAADGALEEQLAALERQRIRDALAANRYNKTQTAKTLGITFRALRYRMEKLGIE